MSRGMMPPKRPQTAPETKPEAPQRAKTGKIHPNPLPKPIKRPESGPHRCRVTMLQPYDKVYVGSRWYVVRNIRMIGRKSNRRSICIVYTLEKGGMHFRVTSKVLRANSDYDV